MRKGLLVFIMGQDCTNNGVTSAKTKAILTGGRMPEIFEPDQHAPELVLHSHNGRLIAVPVESKAGPDDVGPMFGGHWVYTSDSRFPVDHPIAVFDRFETQEQYDSMSI